MAAGDEPAPIPHGAMVLTDPGQIGYIYELFAVGRTPKHSNWGSDVDARFLPGWRVPPVSSDDPLALEYCASHTLLTDQPERMRALLVDVLGGVVIHQSANSALGSDSMYVALGDGIYEIARPVGNGLARQALDGHAGPTQDCYYGITFKTADIAKARAHLAAQGVALAVDEPGLIITDSRHSAGVAWGFAASAVPGDRRGAYPDLAATLP